MYNINDKASAIRDIQRFLLVIGQSEFDIPHLAIDGIFSEETELAVKEFQRKNLLPITGKVERITFDLIYAKYLEKLLESGKSLALDSSAFPLTLGDSGNDVSVLNAIIRELAYYYKDLVLAYGDFYSKDTESSVKNLQEYLREEKTGIVTEKFFNQLKEEMDERQKFPKG